MRLALLASAILALTLATTTPVHAQLKVDEMVKLTRTHFGDGTNLYWRVSPERLDKTPEWDPGQPLPISIKKAVGIAKDYVKKLYPDKPADVVRVELDHVSYKLPGDNKNLRERWIHVIHFDSATIPVDVYILMDGSIVEPVRK